MARLLADALSEHDVVVAAVPQPAGVGRIRRLNLPDDFSRVLVRRPDSGFCDSQGFGEAALEAGDLRDARHGMAKLGAPLAAIRKSSPPAGGAFHAAGGF